MAIRTASWFVALAVVAFAGEGRAVDIGEEVEIGGTPVYLAAPGEQQHPAVAFDGENYLVVWTDDRVLSEPYYAWDIYGARVRASDGLILDTVGFPISTGASIQARPVAAFDGANFLVVWGDSRDDFTGADIFAARVVATDGTVLDPEGIQVSDSERYEHSPAVAFDGENYLAVWQVGLDGDDVGDGEIRGARIRAADGAVLDPDGIVISAHDQYRYDPQVAFLEGSYTVVWWDRRNWSANEDGIYGARVSAADGTVLDPDGLPLAVVDAEVYGDPTIATNGTGFLLAWEQAGPDGSSDLYGTRLDGADLAPLDGDGFPISVAAEAQYSPSASSDGDGYFVVWQDGRNENTGYYVYGWDVYGARVEATDAGVVDPEGIPIYTSPEGEAELQETPVVAIGGGAALVAWDDNRWTDGTPGIYGARVDLGAGEVIAPGDFPISLTENTQGMPAVARGEGNQFLAAWYDGRSWESTGYDIFAALLTIADGAVAEIQEIVVSAAANGQTSPEIAYDGANFLVVWNDERDDDAVYGARIRAVDGAVLDPEGIRLSPEGYYASSPDVAFDGTNYLVVFEQRTNEGADTTKNLFGARVRASDGAVLDPDGIAISAADEDQIYVSVAFGAGEFVVLWSDARNPAGGGYLDLYAARVRGEDGAVLDPDGILVSGALYGQGEAVAAFDGEHFRVAWTDGRAGDNSNLYTALMSPNGGPPSPGNGEEVVTAAHNQFLPDISFNGANSFVVWSDQRAYETSQDDVYGARIDLSGYLIDSFPIATTYWSETSPVLAFGVEGEALLVYERHGADGIRVVGRTLRDDLWEPPDTDTDTESDAGPDGGIPDAGSGAGEGACGCSAAGAVPSFDGPSTLLEVVFRSL